MEWQSQIGQDKYIIEHIFNYKKNGYFIELGATDGKNLSNTYCLEKNFNWDGICIEPNPIYHEKLKQQRSCNLDFSPVFSESGKKVKFTVADEYSGISDYIAKGLYVYNNKEEIELETKTLTQILDDHNAPSYIDYMSLDTEGTELEILKGLDFNKYKIGYISVEHNHKIQRWQIMNYLLQHGYTYSRWNRFDDEYINNDFSQKFCWYPYLKSEHN
jgi:FkbM family methyltransferase